MPFAGYSDFDACTRANSDKRDPEAYCAAIKRQVEEKAHAGVRFGNVGGDPFEDQDTLEDFLDALNEVADEVYIGDTQWPSDDYSIHDRPVEVVGVELLEAKEIWNEFAEDAVALGGPKLIDEDRKALPEPTHLEDSKLNEAELFELSQKADEWAMEKGVWVNSETGDVVYDHRLMGAEPKHQPEGSNPGGNAPETGKQDPEQKAFETEVYSVTGQDGEMEGKTIGVAVDMPNDDVFVDWKNDEFPDELDESHVSIYGSVEDLEQATGNKTSLVDTVGLDALSEKLAVVKASGVPDSAVSVSDESEIPDDAQKIEGPRGGTYYVEGAGDADMDDLADAMEAVAEGNPAAEGQVDAILTHAENKDQVMEAIQEMPPEMQEKIFSELDDDESSRPEPGDELTADEWDSLEEGDVVEAQKPGFGPVKGPIIDLDSSSRMQASGDQVIAIENEYQDGMVAEIGSESHETVEVQETAGGDDSSTSYTESEDVDDSVPEPPREVIENWEQEHSEDLEMEAEAHDMDVDEYKAAVAEEYGRVMENAQPAVRAPSGLLESILEDGRIKNQHETGSSGGWLDPEMRRDFESDYMGVPEDRPDEEMPVYGYASADGANPSEEPDDLDGYGDASIRLSDDAQEQASVTFGDSLSANGGMGGRDEDAPTSFAATPANNPGAESVEPGLIPAGHDEDTQLEMLQNADDPTDLSMYNEMQFHGGIDADQIEEVHIDATADFRDPPDDELLDRLEDAGISVEVET